MPQSLSNILVHIIFSTCDRKPYLKDTGLRQELWRYLGGTSKKNDCPCIIVGGFEDHVHILAHQSKNIALKDWIRELKRASSSWIKTKDKSLEDFKWQSGYGAFSVSQSKADDVVSYIENQDTHHQKVTFEEEYLSFLEKYEIEFDKRYLWD